MKKVKIENIKSLDENLNKLSTIVGKILSESDVEDEKNDLVNYFEIFINSFENIKTDNVVEIPLKLKMEFIDSMFELKKEFDDGLKENLSIHLLTIFSAINDDLVVQFHDYFKDIEESDKVLSEIMATDYSKSVESDEVSDEDYAVLSESLKKLTTLLAVVEYDSTLDTIKNNKTVSNLIKKGNELLEEGNIKTPFKKIKESLKGKNISLKEKINSDSNTTPKKEEKVSDNPFLDVIDDEIKGTAPKPKSMVSNDLFKDYNYGLDSDKVQKETSNMKIDSVEKQINDIKDSLGVSSMFSNLDDILEHSEIKAIEFSSDYGKYNKERIEFMQKIYDLSKFIKKSSIEDEKAKKKIELVADDFKLNVSTTSDFYNVSLVGINSGITLMTFKEPVDCYMNPYEVVYKVLCDICPSMYIGKIPHVKAYANGMIVSYIDEKNNEKIGYFKDKEYIKWKVKNVISDGEYINMFIE